jgi:hypothetical protein
MALLSELVKAVAKVEGADEVSVGTFARAAREARLISQKGRGRGAAQMTSRDAANLLIAFNGSAQAKDVRKRVPKLRALPVASSNAGLLRRRDVRELLAGEMSFGNWLEWLIELARPSLDGVSQLEDLLAKAHPKKVSTYAKRRQLDCPSPDIQLEFWIPEPVIAVKLRIPETTDKSRTSPTIDLVEIAQTVYQPETYEGPTVDRFETITISTDTIFAVARTLGEV